MGILGIKNIVYAKANFVKYLSANVYSPAINRTASVLKFKKTLLQRKDKHWEMIFVSIQISTRLL